MPRAHPKLRVTDGSVGLDGAESLPRNERAYELIRLDVLTFRLKPGEKTSERALEARYGLGVASIRAALPRLVQEGLVEKTTERGTFIAPLTLRGVRDTYQMRYLLEPAAAELAAERGMDPARLDQLRRVCESSWAPGDDDAIIHILLANRDFNLAIAEATGNALLARTIRHLQNLSLRILFLGTTRHDAANFWGYGTGKNPRRDRGPRWRAGSRTVRCGPGRGRALGPAGDHGAARARERQPHRFEHCALATRFSRVSSLRTAESRPP